MNVPYFDGRAMNIAYFHMIDRIQQCNGTLTVAHQPLTSHFPPGSEPYSELPNDPSIEEALDILMHVMGHKRFTVTEKGHVGIAPPASRPGDAIFILKGCNAPLVLRSAGNGAYSVVSECYVDGVMNGEAIRDLEAGRHEMETVILC
ncbi:hypothetical protein F4859DRAFT_458020 [Xylaria cf. heliscus]|nr:hypothetical protein F4859DRAFT_458020 [Xylaria cf. heliscus]